MAPDSISSACLNIAGIAMLPTAENPVKNLAASAQLFHPTAKMKSGTHNLSLADSIFTTVLLTEDSPLAQRETR